MNSQGYTKDNIHKGNTKIVAGGIDVDGLIRVGDQSVGGDGYVLPAVKGTEGQVLTMNSDNTTSFQDSGGLSGRVVKNLFTMIDNNTTFTANPADTRTLYSTGYGSMDIPNIDDFPVGATIHIYAKGVVDANLFLNNSEISLEIDGGTTNIVFTGLVSCNSPSLGNNFFYLDIVAQRTQTNEYKFKGNGLNPSVPTGNQVIMAFADTTITPITPLTQFNMRVTNLYTANQFTPITRVFIANMILDSSLLLTAPPAPTSHLALTDLTADDAGHTQFPLLNGRNGGQVLSGGLTPLHFLTLKSHNTGLNNIVVKDLNTTFEKNIDMDSNDINNANVISSSGVLNIKQNTPANDIKLSVDTEELVIKQSVYGGVKLIEADPLKQIQIGTDDGIGNDSNLRTLSTSTQFDKNIEMNANINDNSGGTNVIGNGVLFWGDVRSTKLTGDGIYEKSTGSQNLALNASNTQSLKNVDMNGNRVSNVQEINGQGGLSYMRIDNTAGLLQIDGGEITQTADTNINLYPNNILRLGNSGQDIVINPATEVDLQGGLNMNSNDITNANIISGGNSVIQMTAPNLGIGTTAGDVFLTSAGKLTGSSIGDTLIRNATDNSQLNFKTGISGNLSTDGIPLNLSSTNTINVSADGLLNLQGGLGNRVDIGVGGSGRMEIEDTRVFISQFADLNIQDKIVYVQPNTMPPVFDDGKTYIFVGSRTTSTPIVLNGISVTFKGSSRETSSIEYTGAGSFITATDCDLSLIDLTLKCNVVGSLLLTASNPSKLNVLSIFNCEVRESYEFADISGHELVDINNTLFIHLRGDGVLTNQKCLYINGVAKTNITSCEIVKFFEIGQPANTNPFDGAMIYITGACGAVSVIGGIIHPRVNQRAVEIDNTATFLEFALNTNNFIDIGLTTGAILQTNSNADWDTNATSEANSLLPNLKTFAGAQLSALNTNNTATVLNTPVDINIGSLLTAFSSFGVSVAAAGGITYLRKRPVNFQVTFVANLQAIDGGAGQRIALSTSKNGVNTGIKSFVTLDSAGTEPKQCTLTLVGTANQGDVFRSQLINESTSSNIRCLDLLVSGIEI